LSLAYNISARTTQKHPVSSVAAQTCLASSCLQTAAARTTVNTVLLLLRACMSRALLRNGRCLQSHRLATGLYTTMYSFIYSYG
jgi:hypothetical protein